MSAQSIQDFLAARPGCRVALVVHQRPDGDAVGSAMGLAGVLRAAGFRPRLVNCRPLPDHLRFIVDDALCLDSDAPEWWRDFDCLGVLDCGELGRLDEINRPGVGALPTFTIDHHVTSKGLGEAVWIEAEASSTGELVVRLRRGAGWPLPAEAATALWTAIVSDTGRFSQENVTPAALEAGRDCLLAGASPVQTARELYQSVSVPERRLQADVLDRLEFHAGGRLSLSWLHHADFLRAGIGVEGAQELINLVRDTAGVEVAVLLYEPRAEAEAGGGTVKVSLRTRSPHSALDLAVPYGGGGHSRAAGASLALALAEAREKVLADALRVYFTPPET